jgi:hypothetical protein
MAGRIGVAHNRFIFVEHSSKTNRGGAMKAHFWLSIVVVLLFGYWAGTKWPNIVGTLRSQVGM